MHKVNSGNICGFKYTTAELQINQQAAKQIMARDHIRTELILKC